MALAGTNVIYGAGMLEMGVTFDLAQLVVDNEIAAMIRKFVAGVRVDDETLAVDEIAGIAPFKDYLSTDFTYAHMRDQSVSKLLDRRVRQEWESDGALDLKARATAKAREILAEYAPAPLPDGVAEQLRAAVAACELVA